MDFVLVYSRECVVYPVTISFTRNCHFVREREEGSDFFVRMYRRVRYFIYSSFV